MVVHLHFKRRSTQAKHNIMELHIFLCICTIYQPVYALRNWASYIYSSVSALSNYKELIYGAIPLPVGYTEGRTQCTEKQ